MTKGDIPFLLQKFELMIYLAPGINIEGLLMTRVLII